MSWALLITEISGLEVRVDGDDGVGDLADSATLGEASALATLSAATW